jgi:hypothetical protein
LGGVAGRWRREGEAEVKVCARVGWGGGWGVGGGSPTAKHKLWQAEHSIAILGHAAKVSHEQRAVAPHSGEIGRLQRCAKVKSVNRFENLLNRRIVWLGKQFNRGVDQPTRHHTKVDSIIPTPHTRPTLWLRLTERRPIATSSLGHGNRHGDAGVVHASSVPERLDKC